MVAPTRLTPPPQAVNGAAPPCAALCRPRHLIVESSVQATSAPSSSTWSYGGLIESCQAAVPAPSCRPSPEIDVCHRR
jgi:hypothetical protein